ncbi:MAG: hypothetical protein HY787_07335 [Deltaproteobacteria bacterium]|nr:hypothetical protein [Deltaproteobacteria bacterium]
MISDTSPEADARQLETFRRMSGEERMMAAMKLSDVIRDIALAGLKNRHPNSSEEELRILFYREMHQVEIKKE